MLKEFKDMAKDTKLKAQEIEFVLKNSVEMIFAELFDFEVMPIYDVISKTIYIPFTGKELLPFLEKIDFELISNKNYLSGDTIFLEYPLEKTNNRIFKQIRKEFISNIGNLKFYQKKIFWIKIMKESQIIQGSFVFKSPEKNIFYIKLKNQTMGILEQEDVNPFEIHRYLPNTKFYFFIKKISLLRETHQLFLNLSRTSKNLPVKLFKKELPGYRFKPIKRLVGLKSCIETNYSFDHNFTPIRERIANELGEIIETKPEGGYSV